MNRTLALALAVLAGPFETPIESGALDPATFSEWVDGAERPIPSKRGPAHVVWMPGSQTEWQGLRFGDTKTPGPRHLRIGLKTPLGIG
ncbi:MAG TPA: hypothetical protein VEN81_14995, partial [Planctomycetota bacterium]|nr:hypothetical protein [Planctomycetota bacterium]